MLVKWMMSRLFSVPQWVRPAGFMVVAATGPYVPEGFSEAIEKNKEWAGVLRLADSWILWIFIVSIVVVFLLEAVELYDKPKRKDLEEEVRQNQSEKGEIGNSIIYLFNGLLLNLANKLDTSPEKHFRISLYVHDADAGAFVPCGRYSPNPLFRKAGRTSYPDNEGCIHQGWLNGWHFDNTFPEENGERLQYHAQKYGVPRATMRGIAMKSRLYAVRRLDSDDASIAVLVIEAIESDTFDAETLRRVVDGSVADYARVIKTFRTYIPSPTTAAESGL